MPASLTCSPAASSRQQAIQYVRGLLAPVERKNGWQVAEAVGDRVPDRMQRLLYRVDWDADVARDRLQHYVVEHFGDADAIGVVDETSFPKKGSASVGVQRQYCGALGKIENCQVATLLTYASVRGHAFLDRRLFLPAAWATDPERRAQAKVPAEIAFATKAQQARAMLEHAWQQGVPMRWVAGDEVYGADPDLRDAIHQAGPLVCAGGDQRHDGVDRLAHPQPCRPDAAVDGRPAGRAGSPRAARAPSRAGTGPPPSGSASASRRARKGRGCTTGRQSGWWKAGPGGRSATPGWWCGAR